MNNSPLNNTLDMAVNSDFMRVCKCALPYLDRDIQKNVAISLKILELMHTINLYNGSNAFSDIPLEKEGNWQRELLRSITQNISPEKSYLLDAILKASEIKSILDTGASHGCGYPSGSTCSSCSNYPTPQPPFYDEANSCSSPYDFSPPPSNSYSDSPSASSSPSPEDIIKSFAPMLDEKQSQLLSLFTSLINNN